MNSKMMFTAALILGAMGTAHANLVTNGGFETGDFAGWTQSGNTAFTAVTKTIDGFAPFAGEYFAYAGPVSSPGFISQKVDLPTVAGQQYTLSYALRNTDTPLTTAQTNHFRALWAGAEVKSLSLTNAAEFGWTVYTSDLIATGATTELKFEFQNVSGYWDLDAVDVQAVPVPAAVWLFGSGLTGLIGMAMRKQQAGTA